jgi:hypothetical protein
MLCLFVFVFAFRVCFLFILPFLVQSEAHGGGVGLAIPAVQELVSELPRVDGFLALHLK